MFIKGLVVATLGGVLIGYVGSLIFGDFALIVTIPLSVVWGMFVASRTFS